MTCRKYFKIQCFTVWDAVWSTV